MCCVHGIRRIGGNHPHYPWPELRSERRYIIRFTVSTLNHHYGGHLDEEFDVGDCSL